VYTTINYCLLSLQNYIK